MRASLERSRCPVSPTTTRSNSWLRPITAGLLLRGGRRGRHLCVGDVLLPVRTQEFIGLVHGGGWMFCFCRELCFRIEISVGAHAHYWRGMARGLEWGGLLLILCSIASSWFFAAGRKWNCAVGRVPVLLLLLRPRWHAAGSDPFTSRSGALARTGRCTAGSPCWPARHCRRP